MIQVNEFIFENDDIGTLAIHLAKAWAPRPAEITPAAIVNGTATGYNGFGVLLGYTLLNTDGAVVNAVKITDSTDGAGPLITAESLPISGSCVRWFGPSGIRIKRGLAVTGTTTGLAVFHLLPNRRHD